MSQTWTIKDTAPVDAASRTLNQTNILFTSDNKRGTYISIYDPSGAGVVLEYGNIGEVAGMDMGSGDAAFIWDNDAYKTLKFDTAPTGELLAWLQKNADLIKVEETHKCQDIRLSDVDLNTQFKQYMATGQYEAALAILQNDQLTDKTLVAALFNYMTWRLVEVQSPSDPTFKQDVIKVATQPPAGMTSGQVYFKLKE